MKILIDARMWNNTGIGTYLKNLLFELDKMTSHPREDGDRSPLEFLALMNAADASNVEFTNIKKISVNIPLYSLKEQLTLGKIMSDLRPDLVHVPHFNVPFFYNGPLVITLHDLTTLRYYDIRPDIVHNLKSRVKLAVQKPLIRNTIKKSKKIIVPSKFVQKDVEKTFPNSIGKINVIYEGHGSYYPAANLPQNISPPYLLYVGSLTTSKNVSTLIEAFEKIYNVITDLKMIIVGSGIKQEELESRIQEKNLPVIFTGYVNDQQLGALYQNASIFVFPSLSEGFGLPPLEAMQYGVPVISSNASCMPEILGDAALFFDPTNPDEISDQIIKVLKDKNLAAELREKGYKQIKKYSWEHMAQETANLYRSIIG